MGEIICPKCGAKILENEKFCVGCGAPRPAMGQEAGPYAAQGSNTPGQGMPPPFDPPAQKYAAYKAPLKKPVLPVVLLAVSCVLLAGALTFAGIKFVFNKPGALGAEKSVNVAAMDQPKEEALTPQITESETPLPSQTASAAAPAVSPSAQPSVVPSPSPSVVPPAPEPSPSAPSTAVSIDFTNIIGKTGAAAITEDQAIQMFGQPLSREKGVDDADEYVDLKYDSFILEFSLVNGKTTNCISVEVTANPAPIAMCGLAIGMSAADSDAIMKAANFAVSYDPKDGTLLDYKNASTGQEIEVDYNNGVVSGYYAMLATF